MDFNRNKDVANFQKTIGLVNGLIAELEIKQKKIRARKKIAPL